MCAGERLSDTVQAIKPGETGRSCRVAANREKPIYRARNPGDSPLSKIVLNNLPEFEQWLKSPPDARPRPHPGAIAALEKFAECGVARYGVVRFRCPECGQDMFVAFSCKRRGLCPSCDAKRSAVIRTVGGYTSGRAQKTDKAHLPDRRFKPGSRRGYAGLGKLRVFDT